MILLCVSCSAEPFRKIENNRVAGAQPLVAQVTAPRGKARLRNEARGERCSCSRAVLGLVTRMPTLALDFDNELECEARRSNSTNAYEPPEITPGLEM